jgi:WD40 repeat protein
MMKAGDSDDPPVTPGKAQDSAIYELLVEPDAHDRMPQKADALPKSEIALVERWINQGAAYDGGSPERPLVELARHTMLRAAPKTYARPMPVSALAFSPDGKQLVVGGYYEITFWNVDDAQLSRRIGGMPEKISAVAWSPTEKLLAVAGGSPNQWGTVVLVEPKTDAKPRYLCDLPETALAVAFSPDGKRLVAGCGDRTVRVFDTATGKQLRVLRHHADWVQSVAYSRDGTRVVSTSRDRTVRVFDPETGEIQATHTGHETPLITAAFSSNGKAVYSLSHGSAIRVWDVASGKKAREIAGTKNTEMMALGSNSLITATSDHLVHVIQLSDLQNLFTLFGQRDVIGAIALSRSSQIFATGGEDGEVCIWSLACGTWVQRFIASPQ